MGLAVISLLVAIVWLFAVLAVSGRSAATTALATVVLLSMFAVTTTASLSVLYRLLAGIGEPPELAQTITSWLVRRAGSDWNLRFAVLLFLLGTSAQFIDAYRP
jgi:hypothetical protein